MYTRLGMHERNCVIQKNKSQTQSNQPTPLQQDYTQDSDQKNPINTHSEGEKKSI